MRDPIVIFLIVLVIGILAGLLFDRFAGPGWLTRQIAGSTRTMVTSALVGVAGSFIGYHLATILRLGAGGYGAIIGAIVGALLVLWLWRLTK
jgi:uncharacterized membrane protein YeaQ/YmgE (transglycosylase-associated protein family)